MTSRVGLRSVTGGVQAEKSRVGGKRNRMSRNEAKQAKVDRPVCAPIVEDAVWKSASV
jgi:hypothetical protein